jgi:hypothetical protein
MGTIHGSGPNGGGNLRQLSAIILVLAGLGMASLFFIIPQYHMRQQVISLAREQAMRGNMRVLQVSLEQYLAEDGRGYPASLSRTDPRREDPLLDFLSSSLLRLQNPFDRGVPAVAVSRRDPPFWKSFKRGQIIYVPLEVRDGYAAGYLLYGLGSSGPIATVIDRRPEPGYLAPGRSELGPGN